MEQSIAESRIRAQEFSKCSLSLHVLHTPTCGVPDDFLTGVNVILTVGLTDSCFGRLIEDAILDSEVGSTVKCKTCALPDVSTASGFDGLVYTKRSGPWTPCTSVTDENSNLGDGDEASETINGQEQSEEPLNSDGSDRGASQGVVKKLDSIGNPAQSLYNDVEVTEQTFEFQVTLTDVEPGKPPHQLTDKEKLDRAAHLKDVGTRCFQKKNLHLAFRRYSRSLKYCILVGAMDDVDAELKPELQRLKSQCYFNLAACHMQKENHGAALHCCTQGLLVDPHNVKGLFRRSQAFTKLGRYTEACEDLKEAAALDPNNKAVTSQLKLANEAMKREDKGMAQAMGKMFSGKS